MNNSSGCRFSTLQEYDIESQDSVSNEVRLNWWQIFPIGSICFLFEPKPMTHESGWHHEHNRPGGRIILLPGFCYGDESSGHHACMNGHLTTANQSEIRKAYLVSACSQ